MITKLLLLIGVIALVYFFFFKKKKPSVTKQQNGPREKLQSEDMVQCANCGVYAQVEDSILSNGKYYCSDTCLQKG